VNSASGTNPTGKEPSVKASCVVSLRNKIGEGCPALMYSSFPLFFQDAEEHRGVSADLGVITQESD